MEIVSRSYRGFKPRTAEAIEEIVSRAPSNVRAWAARELKKGRVPPSDYDVLLPTLQRIADRGNFWEKTWKEAAGVKNWAYLNGQVHFADRPFEALRALAEAEGNQEAKALANHWLAGNTIIPPGHKDAIAHGELTPDGHVLFLNTNADRNQVRDAVLTRTSNAFNLPAWDMSPIINNRELVEREYAQIMANPQPHLQNPHVLKSWKALADESAHYADYIRQHIKVEPVAHGEPYATTQDMFDDIQQNRHMYVSNLNAEHPLHGVDDIVNWRTVHDVFGHAATGGDFGWDGEARACSTHHALSSPHAAAALTTECLGQTGWALKNGFEGLTQHPGFLPQTHGLLVQANQNAPRPTKEQLLQMALTPKQAIPSRQSSPVGPIQKSPHGPSPWSPQGLNQKFFTIGIGNTTTDEFMRWVQTHAPNMVQFMRIQDGVGLFEGSPETSVSARFFDTDLATVKKFLDLYGSHHPEEWGFGLEWGNGSTVYQNKSNDGSVEVGNLDDNKSREDDDEAEVGMNKQDDWVEAPSPVERRLAKADLNGTMVSLDVPKEHQGQLAVRGGERPNNLHCTLAYIPSGVRDHAAVARLLNDVAAKFGPQQTTVKKMDSFPETKDKDVPHIAVLEGDGLHDMATAVRSGLKALGEDVDEKYDFNPHITIAYKKPDEEFIHPNEIEGMPIHFPAMHLHQAGDIQEFQLGKSPVMAAVAAELKKKMDEEWAPYKPLLYVEPYGSQ